jgi:hypothetical protein
LFLLKADSGGLYFPHWAHRKPASPYLSRSFPRLPIFLHRIVSLHCARTRFLISSEENRYGYDYRARRPNSTAGD